MTRWMGKQGSLKIEQVGTYVLIFDNSFSRLMSKRLTFWTDIKTGKLASLHTPAALQKRLDPSALIPWLNW